MTFDEVRAMVLAWPAVEEGTAYGSPAIKVKGKFLTRVRDGDTLVVPGVDFDERELLMEMEPEVYYITDHYRGYPTVLVRLSKADPKAVKALLIRRWKAVAPKKLLKDFPDAAG